MRSESQTAWMDETDQSHTRCEWYFSLFPGHGLNISQFPRWETVTLYHIRLKAILFCDKQVRPVGSLDHIPGAKCARALYTDAPSLLCTDQPSGSVLPDVRIKYNHTVPVNVESQIRKYIVGSFLRKIWIKRRRTEMCPFSIVVFQALIQSRWSRVLVGAKSKVKNIRTVQNRSTSPGAIICWTQWGLFGQEEPCSMFDIWRSLKSQRNIDVLTDTSPVRRLFESLFHRIDCLRLKKQLCPYQMALRVGSNFGHWISLLNDIIFFKKNKKRRKTNHQTPLEGAIQRSPPGDYRPVQRPGHLVQELVSSGILGNSDWKHMDRSHWFGLNAEPTARE